jgi:16S rRNA (uracil1498-N3)-methyltransferase
MPRFFCPSRNISREEIILDNAADIHHIRDVLRLKSQNEVEVFDEQRNDYLCSIKKIMASKITLHIKEKKALPGQGRVSITIACAIPKKSLMDEVIDKLTQLGVERIIPLETQHVIVRLDADKKSARLERWRKIAQSAAQQSHRNTLPVIEPVKSVEEVLALADNYDLKLIPTLSGKRRLLKDIINAAHPKNILILIGPEGDFSPAEVKLACSKGCLPVSLGELVLRVDTAAIAVASYLLLSL